MNVQTAEATLLELTPDTMIQIPGRKQPVRVESVEMINGNVYVFTTSGRVRPGSIKGGTLKADRWNPGKFSWQSTMQQQVVTIDSFEVLGLAA